MRSKIVFGLMALGACTGTIGDGNQDNVSLERGVHGLSVDERISVATVNGQGVSLGQSSGEPFSPRGSNYLRLVTVNGTQVVQTFDPDTYSCTAAQSALSQMKANGYNYVRVITAGSFGDQQGYGMNSPGIDP